MDGGEFRFGRDLKYRGSLVKDGRDSGQKLGRKKTLRAYSGVAIPRYSISYTNSAT